MINQDHIKLENIVNSWVQIFNELTYLGRRKSEVYRELDSRFGRENWLPAHFFNGEIVSRASAYLIYEEAYYQFLKDNPETLKKLVITASEVYDIQPSNVESGLDYEKQECNATHLQDISIRRVLTRLKLEEDGTMADQKNLPKIKVFYGDHLVQIRDHTSEGYHLNPGKVPFHRPDLILDTEQNGWWDKDSVEDWYQKNKVLLVNPESFLVGLIVASPDFLFFSDEGDNYYSVNRSNNSLSLCLRKISGKKIRRLYSEDKSFTQVNNSPIMPYSEWIKKQFPHFNRRLVDLKMEN